MSKETKKKTVAVAFGVCLVCSVLVSAAAVSLSGIQAQNKKLDRLKNILLAGDMFSKNVDIEQIYKENIDTQIINLENGSVVPEKDYNEKLDPQKFDIKKMADDPQYGKAIPADEDKTGIKRQPRFMVIYKVVKDGKVKKIILPVYGKGIWSTMYGFIALGEDLQTVTGFTFYEHGETPGLGGEVDNPRWKRSWVGKKAFDEKGNVVIEVIKGTVDQSGPKAESQIDGLSGATLTTRGVDNLVRYWLGKNGYGPYLANLRERGIK
ncbi:MAG: Na(+)-translocating NADH-quinone reductase subunit C [Deltaproteobacteria bacterium]|nr:Na(+)-translocating NADH-quinone reductase subunit C [Deltaproteobacteria bacterium]